LVSLESWTFNVLTFVVGVTESVWLGLLHVNMSNTHSIRSLRPMCRVSQALSFFNALVNDIC
jgi:hypothetical protein